MKPRRLVLPLLVLATAFVLSVPLSEASSSRFNATKLWYAGGNVTEQQDSQSLEKERRAKEEAARKAKEERQAAERQKDRDAALEREKLRIAAREKERTEKAAREESERKRKDDEQKVEEEKRLEERKKAEACRTEDQRPEDCPPPPTSLINVTAGYTVVRYDTPDSLPVGWSVGVTAKTTHFFAIVSELSVAFDADGAVAPATHRTALLFLDGIRIIAPTRRVTVFAEALLGVAHDRDFRPGATDKNRFVWKPGAGVDFRLSSNVSVRFQSGVILDPVGDDRSKAFQFTSGLVFGR